MSPYSRRFPVQVAFIPAIPRIPMFAMYILPFLQVSKAIEMPRGIPIAQFIGPKNQKLSLIVDTGAGRTVVDTPWVEKLGLKASGTIGASGTGGRVMASTLAGFTIEIGQTTVSLPAVGIPIGLIGTMLDTKVDGILGYEFFVGRIVEIDYAKKEIGILPMFTLDDGFISCDLTFDGMRPFLRAEVELPDGTLKSGKFLLDTGANDALSVGESFAKIYKLTVETGRPTGGVGGIRLGKSTAIKSLRIGPLSFDVRKPAVQPSRADEGDGLIGSGLLRGRRLVIDYDRKKAYISR